MNFIHLANVKFRQPLLFPNGMCETSFLSMFDFFILSLSIPLPFLESIITLKVFFADSSPDSQTTITSPTQHKEKKSTVLSPIGSPSQTCYETWHSGNLAEYVQLKTILLCILQ